MRVLLVVHGFPPGAGGGTEIYTHDLARALSRLGGVEVSVLAREAAPGRPEYAIRSERRDGLEIHLINNTFRACRSFRQTYRNAEIDALAGRLLAALQPDLVHVQHLTCLSTGIVEEAARRQVPVVVTLNDYWLLC
ncbi:MAG: glycosyltransferase, partial [Acidobacteriota bacterium]